MVEKPRDDDPYCFSNSVLTPLIRNTAIVDGSRFYSSGLPWPPAPKGESWDSVSTELPGCYHLVVNKEVTPLSTTPNFGPNLNYTVTIINASGSPSPEGDIHFPVTSPWSGPVFTDRFQIGPQPVAPPITQPTNIVDPCTPTGDPCLWLQPPNLSNHQLGISRIDAGSSLSYSYELPPNFNPHRICNDIRGQLSINGWPSGRWYAKDPQTLVDQGICANIRTNLTIEKIFNRPTELGSTNLGNFCH